MYEINREKFGRFVAQRRREKGLTQKELAGQLYLSDKAISKWETGVSLPDTAMLIPLAELLDVSVTELLMGEKMEEKQPLEADQVEELVKTAIVYAEEKPLRAWQVKSRWPFLYAVSLFLGAGGMILNAAFGRPCLETPLVIAALCAAFGAYFCFFARTRLPAFYDEYAVDLYSDGLFRMNLPGVHFTNSNWPHMVRCARVSLCLFLAVSPVANYALTCLAKERWTGSILFLILFLTALFLPMYEVGKKYGE